MKMTNYPFFKPFSLSLLLLLSLTSCKKGVADPPDDTPINSSGIDLDNPAKKEIAMKLVSSAENSTLDWRSKYDYIEDIQDGRGYTAGIIGFTSGTGDMLAVVTSYATHVPGNILAKYIPALKLVNNSSSHEGLDPDFPKDWKTAATDSKFKAEQDNERDQSYFLPALKLAKADGLHALGQFIYYDAAVVHGYDGLEDIRKEALKLSKTPAAGASERTYLNAFLDKRVIEMQKEAAHSDVSRIEKAQRVFLKNGNFDLNLPLNWKGYDDNDIYEIK